MMELKQLNWSKPATGIKAFQVTRGKVNPRNPYSEFNLCNYTGDDALRVLDARIQLCTILGIDMDNLIMPRQTHSARVAVIDDKYMQADIDAQETMLEGIDALVTTLPGICIGVNTADCVNIALTDPIAGIIAIVHAGWRGTVARIPHEALNTMKQLGADPRRILATMGASICGQCYEVGDEVVEEFARHSHDLTRIMHRNADTGKAHIDLRLACSLVMQDDGIPADNITISNECSRCLCDKYFSARRLGINSGRTFTGIIKQ